MVLLREAPLPPHQWRLGRITNVHPGSDGAVRAVTVRTTDGEYKRVPVTLRGK